MFINYKKTIIFTTILLFILIIIYINLNSFSIKNENKNFEILFKNITWDTKLLKNIPFNNGNEIELNLLIPGDGKNNISLNKDKLKSLNIEKIIVNDKEVGLNESDFKNVDNIKIIGKSKNNGILNENDFNDIINIKEDKKEEIEIKNDIKKSLTGSININLDKYNLNSNINNLIKISGDKKYLIKYVNIGGINLTPIIDKEDIFLSIEKNTFGEGEYFIILQMIDNSIHTLDKKIFFSFSDTETNIANITPKSIKNDTDNIIVLQGNGFSKVISLQLSNNTILKNASFEIISDQVMSVKIPKNLDKGTYFFNIMTTKGIINLKNNTFIIN
ncbi:hypothetical protein H3C61_01690 [Candidatus Gracilibacteria bacterium]|nr:hypothetical protein [Candidatus Gracilibacteria bacterium]